MGPEGPGLQLGGWPPAFPLCRSQWRPTSPHQLMKRWEENVSKDFRKLVLEPQGLADCFPTSAVTLLHPDDEQHLEKP